MGEANKTTAHRGANICIIFKCGIEKSNIVWFEWLQNEGAIVQHDPSYQLSLSKHTWNSNREKCNHFSFHAFNTISYQKAAKTLNVKLNPVLITTEPRSKNMIPRAFPLAICINFSRRLIISFACIRDPFDATISAHPSNPTSNILPSERLKRWGATLLEVRDIRISSMEATKTWTEETHGER